jgi:hypothetical protein
MIVGNPAIAADFIKVLRAIFSISFSVFYTISV